MDLSRRVWTIAHGRVEFSLSPFHWRIHHYYAQGLGSSLRYMQLGPVSMSVVDTHYARRMLLRVRNRMTITRRR